MAKIENFVGWKLMWWVYRALKEIQVAEGYNYSPTVTMDFHEYQESTAKAAVFLECDSHSTVGSKISGATGGVPRFEQSLDLVLHCNVKLGVEEQPRRAAFALEQDVRTCLHGGLPDLVAAMGRGFVFRFSDCRHDGGVLAPDREAGFRLSLNYKYPQGSNW